MYHNGSSSIAHGVLPVATNTTTFYVTLTTGTNGIVCIMVLINNILLLVTLAKTRQLQTLTNAYIASLSVADLLVGIVLIVRPFWLIPSTEWVFNKYKYVCMPIICLLYVNAMESIACLVLVSMDRYLYIVHPFWYERNVTSKRTFVLIAASWIMSLILGLLPLEFNSFSASTGCNAMTIVSKYYLLYFLSFYFFVAAAIITFMYGRIFCVGNHHRRKIEAVSMSQSKRTRKERSLWHVVRFLLLVCGIFFLCWSPLAVVNILYFTLGAPEIVVSIAVSIAALNSSLNFFVLLATNRTFREALAKQACHCRKRVDVSLAISIAGTSFRPSEANTIFWTTSLNNYRLKKTHVAKMEDGAKIIIDGKTCYHSYKTSSSAIHNKVTKSILVENTQDPVLDWNATEQAGIEGTNQTRMLDRDQEFQTNDNSTGIELNNISHEYTHSK